MSAPSGFRHLRGLSRVFPVSPLLAVILPGRSAALAERRSARPFRDRKPVGYAGRWSLSSPVYQRLLAELAIENSAPLRTMRIFDPLPGDIQGQAREWPRVGCTAPAKAVPKAIHFIDITDDYERSIRRLLIA